VQQAPPSRRYVPQGEGESVSTIVTPDLDPGSRAGSAIGACGPGHPPTRERRGLLKIYRKGRGEGAKGAEGMIFVAVTPDVIRGPEQRVRLVCVALDTRLRGCDGV